MNEQQVMVSYTSNQHNYSSLDGELLLENSFIHKQGPLLQFQL